MITDSVKKRVQHAVERYYGSVRGLLACFTRDSNTADDLTQEVFIRLCVAFQREPQVLNVWALIRSIMRNVCLEHMRSRRGGRNEFDAELAADTTATGPAELVEHEDLLAKLSEAWQELTEEERAVVVGRYMYEMTGEQLAESLGAPRRTLLDRLDKAMLKLQRFFAKSR